MCVKSRTVYVMTIGVCTLNWVSNLQTEIALSTLEAEYIYLSHTVDDIPPLRRLIQEVGTQLEMDF